VSCRGLDSNIVGGISRDRDFLLMLFSFAVSVTNYAFPYMTPAASTHNTAPTGRRAHRLSASRSPTASELEDREEAMVDVEARMPTPALDASASGELNTLSISDRLRVRRYYGVNEAAAGGQSVR
jgi:hypothetical protein